MNLLEYMLLNNQKNEFVNLYAAHKDAIDQYADGNVIAYLNALRCLIGGELEQAIQKLDAFVKKFPGETKKYLGTWSFDEVSHVIAGLPTGKQKDLLVKTVQFFDGVISSNDFEAFLKQLEFHQLALPH